MDADNQPVTTAEEERYYVCRLTRKGKALLAKQELAKWKGQRLEISITRVMAGGGYVDPAGLEDLDDVANPIAEMELGPHGLLEGDDCAVRLLMRLSSAAIPKTVLIRQLVVFADDPEVGEVAYQVLQYHWDNPQPLSSMKANYGAVSIFENEMILVFADGEAVAIPQSPGWFLSQDDYEATLPTTHIATITHEFPHTPMFALYKTDHAFGTQRFGAGPFGGGPSRTVSDAYEVGFGGKVDVFSTYEFGEGAKAVRHSKNQVAFLYDGSPANLLLKMR